MNSHVYRLVVGISLLALLAGCEAELPDGPPAIRLGLDECVHCGMIISDQRSAAASIILVNGKRQALLFDDIGDMLDYHQRHTDLAIHRRYVSDYQTRQWIEFSAASYVYAPDVQTPMGSGLLAYTVADDAARATAQYSGRQATSDELPAIRTKPATARATCCHEEEGQ